MNAIITALSGKFTGAICETSIVDAGPMIKVLEEVLAETAPEAPEGISTRDIPGIADALPGLPVLDETQLHDGPLAGDTKEAVVIMSCSAFKFVDDVRVAKRVDQLDDYQRRVIDAYIKELRRLGLDLNVDDTTLEATLTGRLEGIDYGILVGASILSDAGNIPLDAKVAIKIDLWTTLQWHHISAQDRKRWFQEAASILGVTSDKPSQVWKEAKNVVYAMSEHDLSDLIDKVGRPIPYVPDLDLMHASDLDQMLVIGRNYTIRIV